MSVRKIYIELTNECNLNCRMCYRRSWSEENRQLDKEMLLKIYDDCKKLKIGEVVLGGIGEPTFSPLIKDALELFSEFNLTLTTNATISDYNLTRLISRTVKKLVVSIDGLEEKYFKIRGNNLNLVLENLKEFKKLKENDYPEIVIEFVISKENKDDVFGLIDLASSLDANYVIVSNVIPQTDDYKDKILYTRCQNLQMTDFIQKMRLYSFRKGINLTLPYFELKTERYCPFIENDALVVGSDGLVYPCYRFLHNTKEYIFSREKKILKYPFGDLREKSLEEIYESEKYKNFKWTIYGGRYPSCVDCDLIDACDMVKTNEFDCYTISPTCGDCLWARRISICP